MTRNEAKAALWEGYKITHPLFSPGEFIQESVTGMYVDESGYELNPALFWTYRRNEPFDEGWEIKED